MGSSSLFHEHIYLNASGSSSKGEELVKIVAYCSIEKDIVTIHVKRCFFNVLYRADSDKSEYDIEEVLSAKSFDIGSMVMPLAEIEEDYDISRAVKSNFNLEEHWKDTDVLLVSSDNPEHELS